MRLALRFSAWYLAALVLILLGQAVFRAQGSQDALTVDAQRDLERIGEGFARALETTWRNRGPEEALALAEDAELGDVTLEVLARERPSEPGELVAHISLGLEGRLLRISEPAPNLRPQLRRALGSAAVTSVFSAILYALLAVGLGAILIGRPVRRLVDKTRRLRAGEDTRDLDVHAGELGEVAQELNRLADALGDAEVQVARAHADRGALLEQLRHADRLATVGQLAASVAHELGTPLSVIVGRAQSIARGRVEGERATHAAEIVAAQGERISEIIRRLLDFSRRTPAGIADVDLEAQLPLWLEVLAPYAHRAGVELVLTVEPGAIARADPALLAQVVTNLVTNAIHAQPEGGDVRIAAHPDGEHFLLTVADRGEGMDDTLLDRIFEPFFTTKPEGKGTGLGLSVVREILDEAHGTVEVESAPGVGSVFTVRLPRGGL